MGARVLIIGIWYYSLVRAALLAHATSSDDMTAIGTLPDVVPTGINVFIAQIEAAALGLIPVTTPLDAYVGFSSTANFSYDLTAPAVGQYDFFGTVAHEISEVMDRYL